MKYKVEDRYPGSKMLGHIFFDPWIAMLCLGAVSSHLGIPSIALGYWTCVLLVIALQAIYPERLANWKIRKDKS